MLAAPRRSGSNAPIHRTHPEELYPARPDLRDYREQLPGGWYVATNLNNVLKKSIIRLAAEVAGLRFGEDVRVEF